MLEPGDIPIGTATSVFMLLFGGAVFVLVANSIFTNSLVSGLAAVHIQGADPGQVVHLGATADGLKEDLESVLNAYMGELTDIYRLGLIMACLCAIRALGMEWANATKEGISFDIDT